MSTLNTLLNWLNSEPAHTDIVLQRDGYFPFLGYADLNQPPEPIFAPLFGRNLTLQTLSYLIILAVGLPVVFLV